MHDVLVCVHVTGRGVGYACAHSNTQMGCLFQRTCMDMYACMRVSESACKCVCPTDTNVLRDVHRIKVQSEFLYEPEEA
jgi:hypothetical protein